MSIKNNSHTILAILKNKTYTAIYIAITLLSCISCSGIKDYIPKTATLSENQQKNWLSKNNSKVTYTEIAKTPFPIIPFQVFGVKYDADIVIVTEHPVWTMHEYAKVNVGDKSFWLAKDSDQNGLQTVMAGLPNILNWLPEVAVPRVSGDVKTIDRSNDDVVDVDISYTNIQKELVEVSFKSPRPKKTESKRNSSSFNHSHQSTSVLLDVAGKQMKNVFAKVSFNKKPAKIKKALGLVPIKGLLEQTQGGVMVASMEISLQDDSHILLKRPANSEKWYTNSEEVWHFDQNKMTYDNGATSFVYYFENRECTKIEAFQKGIPNALFSISFSSPLPDLSRPFDGEIKRNFIADVNGQKSHGHGIVVASWENGESVLKFLPESPFWFKNRPMESRINFSKQTVKMTTKMI